MRQVKIAEFKSHLSAHLREVQAGAEIMVLDRHHPIARISPVGEENADFLVRPAKINGGLKKLKFRRVRSDFDVVKILREDRNSR